MSINTPPYSSTPTRRRSASIGPISRLVHGGYPVALGPAPSGDAVPAHAFATGKAIYPRRCFLPRIRAKAFRAASISGNGSSCRCPGWPMRPYSRAREETAEQVRPDFQPVKPGLPFGWREVSPVRRLQADALSAWSHAARPDDPTPRGKGLISTLDAKAVFWPSDGL
jgi:hypothetical protein